MHLISMIFIAQNFLDNFQTAQQAIADASAAAAETAKQNMVEAYSNAKRMALNIRIKAPIIIVPVDSQSLQAISIDLGHLCITNHCSAIPNSAVVRNKFLETFELPQLTTLFWSLCEYFNRMNEAQRYWMK